MAADFGWRKKELSKIKTMVLDNENAPHNRDVFIRAGITLLYAHWEGFIKRIGSIYLEFVGESRLKNEEVSSNFLALALTKLVREAATSSRIQPSLEIISFFQTQMSSRIKLNWKAGVNTKSNLMSAVLQEIVAILGLDYSRFATKEKLIDEKLLKNRNSIAHGQYLLVDFDEYLNLHDEILGIMQDFYNQVENSAFTGAYKK